MSEDHITILDKNSQELYRLLDYLEIPRTTPIGKIIGILSAKINTNISIKQKEVLQKVIDYLNKIINKLENQ